MHIIHSSTTGCQEPSDNWTLETIWPCCSIVNKTNIHFMTCFMRLYFSHCYKQWSILCAHMNWGLIWHWKNNKILMWQWKKINKLISVLIIKPTNCSTDCFPAHAVRCSWMVTSIFAFRYFCSALVTADFDDIDVHNMVACFRIRVTAFTKVKYTLKMKTWNT